MECLPDRHSPAGMVYENKDHVRVPVDKNDFSILADGQRSRLTLYLWGFTELGEDGKLQGYLIAWGSRIRPAMPPRLR